MSYDFSTVIDRKNTNSVKWDFNDLFLGAKDILPFWIADMDFKAPPEVIEAIVKTASHGIYGYSYPPESFFEAVRDWTGRRYGWRIEREWLSYASGIITGLNIAIQTFTRPGEKIIVQPPVYPPFYSSVENNGRLLSFNPLVKVNDRYEMDYENLEKIIDKRTKMLILCNPHNPVGRVWTKDELHKLAEICIRHDLIIFSDEIHGDIIYSGHIHTPISQLSEEISMVTITGIAPSKTFNIPGLKASVIIMPNKKLKDAYDLTHEKIFGHYEVTTFAISALEAAYTKAEPWLMQLIPYLEENVLYTESYFRNKLPEVIFSRPEGTFLIWLDFSYLRLTQPELTRFLYKEARVGLQDGKDFRTERDGYMRLNIGCPRPILEEGLDRLYNALKSI